MPLPAALQAKLARRGLLSNSSNNENRNKNKRPADEEEEIIAESYDEPSSESENTKPEPNKKPANIEKKFQPHPVMEKRRIRMLKIYPLPSGWIEVPDLETNRYYYWNVDTNQVCWLSPSHPKAKYEYPKGYKKKEAQFLADSNSKEQKKTMFDNYKDFVDDIDSIAATTQSDYKNKPKNNSKKKKESYELDPMDPASYSNIPRGKWSAGLEGTAKTGADETASGSLTKQNDSSKR